MHTIRVPRTQKMFRVYLPGQSRKDESRLLVDAQTADYWVACGFAVNLGRSNIALKKTLPLKLRDQSSNIREPVMLAAATGSKYHRALCSSWRSRPKVVQLANA